MSLYSVHSPITNGELVKAAIEVVDRSHFYFIDLNNREDLQNELRKHHNLFQFRCDKDCQDILHSRPLLLEVVSDILATLESFFGAPWANNEERVATLFLWWEFRNLVKVQVGAPQYPDHGDVFGGPPYCLLEEKDLIAELLAGNMDESRLLRKINSDMFSCDELLPYRVDYGCFGACRNFQKGIILARQGDTIAGLAMAIRSFIFFLSTLHLWWRKAVIGFIFDQGVMEELVRQREEDFAIALLLKEYGRQQAISKVAAKFKKKAVSTLTSFIDFEWLNMPFDQKPERQLSFGVVRDNTPWWKYYQKK